MAKGVDSDSEQVGSDDEQDLDDVESVDEDITPRQKLQINNQVRS